MQEPDGEGEGLLLRQFTMRIEVMNASAGPTRVLDALAVAVIAISDGTRPAAVQLE